MENEDFGMGEPVFPSSPAPSNQMVNPFGGGVPPIVCAACVLCLCCCVLLVGGGGGVCAAWIVLEAGAVCVVRNVCSACHSCGALRLWACVRSFHCAVA